jgi:hypothetical protein
MQPQYLTLSRDTTRLDEEVKNPIHRTKTIPPQILNILREQLFGNDGKTQVQHTNIQLLSMSIGPKVCSPNHAEVMRFERVIKNK